jgi:hypothetical protein
LIIDRNLDFRDELKSGQDPDQYSKTLQAYHKVLWSKKLPSGRMFSLQNGESGTLLRHSSNLGDFTLSSDTISHSYIFVKRMKHIVEQLDEQRKQEILKSLFTIGGFILFPSNKIANRATINGARGLSARIVDRFDLTLECIRRHYEKEDSPLSLVLGRYSDFFALFQNFEGYVRFFLLNDLVDEGIEKVKFFLPFDNCWPTQPLPKSFDEYEVYIENTINFVSQRGSRIENFVSQNS